MDQSPKVMTRNAQKGDIVVFSCGLLTPEWVVKKLKGCEDNLKSRNKVVENTIVIVIDSCYSGVWNTRMRQSLSAEPAKPLQCTRVILQTSCGENEVSYGQCFTPVFCALQDGDKRKELLQAYENHNQPLDGADESFEWSPQIPTIYDSRNEAIGIEVPYFFQDANFFTFCLKTLTISWFFANPRGIPDDQLKSFFESFGSQQPPPIYCFKLKRHRSGSPQAFFLMEWNSKLYHIHLHFNNFNGMKLTGVSHVDVSETGSWPIYAEIDPKVTKCRINYNCGNQQWGIVERNKQNMIDHCKAFVNEQKTWDREEDWTMTHAIPNLIRSRSAHFKEGKEKCMPMTECKRLYETNN